MVIIDTNIWIEFFKARDPYYEAIKKLIEKREVIALEVVFSELAQGCKNEREIKIIGEYWNNLTKYSEDNLLFNAANLSYSKKLISKGIGLIDSVIVYAALKNEYKIWTLDKKIHSVIDRKKYQFALK